MKTKELTNRFRFGFALQFVVCSAASVMFCSCQVGPDGYGVKPIVVDMTGEATQAIAETESNSTARILFGDQEQPARKPAVSLAAFQSEEATETQSVEKSIADTQTNEKQQPARIAQLPADCPALPLPGQEICPLPIQEGCPLPELANPCPPPIPYCGPAVAPVAQELKSSFTKRDEYVCDGGDRNQRVTIGKDFSIRGLDIEDTIAHFDTLDGKRLVQPSNRVCVYAPRFGAVRKTYGVALSAARTQIGKADKTVGAIDRRDTLSPNTTMQQAQPIDAKGNEFAQKFIERTRAGSVDKNAQARGTDNFIRPISGEHLLRYGQMGQQQKARIAREALQAEFWTDNQSAQAVVDGVLVANAISSQRLQDITGSEERISRQKMRIIKSASKGAAKPGDMIEFTIRFENLSNEKVGNVTIIDNLSPRLEFVEGTQTCSVDADFIATENEVNSLLLRWEIKEPMDPDTGGVVRFKCLVR